MKISVCFPQGGDLAFGVEFAVLADQLGYYRLWLSEAYGFESFSMLGALAAATTRIELAAGIVNVFGRSAATIGQAAATVDAISGGRFVLGLGSSGPGVVTGWHGVPFDRPLDRIRDYVNIIRMILQRERVRYRGRAVSLDGGIRLLHEPVRANIPIYLGSISRRGVMLATEIADGWLPNHFAPERFRAVLDPALDEGLAMAGRNRNDLKLAPYHVPVVVTGDRAAGLDNDRSRLALYIGGMGTAEKNYYKDLYQRYGYVREADVIQRLYLAGDRKSAAAAVTDAMIAEGAVVGTVDECRRRLEDFASCGADEVVLSIRSLSGTREGLLQTLGELAPVRETREPQVAG